MVKTRTSRRDFLCTSTVAAAGISLPWLIPSRVLGRPNRPGAGDTVNVGVIGLGFRGYGVAGEGKEVKGFRVVAVCDCYRPRLDGFLKDFSPDGKLAAYEDFRRMIDKENLDAVMVETPTHARAWIVVQALQAGMDAYIEKPMCSDDCRGPGDGPGCAEVQSRHPGRNPAAVDAD